MTVKHMFLKNKKTKIILAICTVAVLGIGLTFVLQEKNSNSADIRIPKKYTNPLVIAVFNNTLSIKPVGATEVKRKMIGNLIEYADVFMNTNIVQTRETNKLKEDIVLKGAGHPKKFEYELNFDDYDYEIDNKGDLNLYTKGYKDREDKNLYKIFTIPKPFMFEQDKPNEHGAVEMKIENNRLILIPDKEWINSHNYPIIVDPTVEINILNLYSHPQKGDNWEVEFTTTGKTDLKIIPNDPATINDDEFVGLYCGEKKVKPQILDKDIIYYPNWQCNKTAKIVHYTLIAGKHTLRFEFGDKTTYAYNDAAATDNWWNASWTKRRSITINNADQSTEFSSFPFLVEIMDKDTSRIDYAETQNLGEDIRFINYDGTLLDYEIELWDETATSTVWVEIPTIESATSTQYIYMYYGNDGASDAATTTGVWDENFFGVWHLDEDWDAAADDSTRKANDGTHTNFYSATSTVTGKIGKAIDFDETDDRTDHSAPAASGGADTTVSFWAKLPDQASNTITYNAQWQNNGWNIGTNWTADGLLSVTFHRSGATEAILSDANLTEDDVWTYVSMTFDQSTFTWYKNGSQFGDADAFAETWIAPTVANLDIGAYGNYYHLDGIVDEFRISNTKRSADWIALEYCNMNNSCAAYGGEETVPLVTETRSVGTGGDSVHTTGTADNTAGTAIVTFSDDLALNVGIGDAIVFDPEGDAETYYIKTRDSDTQVTLQSGTSESHSGDDFKIGRVYATITTWESTEQADLTAGSGTIKQAACYADGDMDDKPIISGWTTATTTYIRIYTPTSTDEVGISQRHDGTEGTGFVLKKVDTSSGSVDYDIFDVAEEFVRIEGLEIDGSGVENKAHTAALKIGNMNDGAGIFIDSNIIHAVTNSTTDDGDGSPSYGIRIIGGMGFIFNNMVYDIDGVSRDSASDAAGIYINEAGVTWYVYNNTIFDIEQDAVDGSDSSDDAMGLWCVQASSPCVIKNNYVGDLTADDTAYAYYEQQAGAFSDYSELNVSFDATTASSTTDITNKTSYTDYFSSASSPHDLHLKADSNTLWGSYGADLDEDTNLSITQDIDDDTRDTTNPDMGADEHNVTVSTRSVGTGGDSVHTTGTADNTAGTAIVTFSDDLALNVGIGDAIVFDPDGDAETYYIKTRDNIRQVTLETITSESHSGDDFKIGRAYATITAWETAEDGDLTAGSGTIKQAACYADGDMNDGGAGISISGWTTATSSYVRIYTPTSTDEVGISQRHTGVEGTGFVLKPSIDLSGTAYRNIMYINEDFVRLEGIEFDGSNIAGGENIRGMYVLAPNGSGSDIIVENNIIHDLYNSEIDDSDASSVLGMILNAGRIVARNNFIYNLHNYSHEATSDAYGISIGADSNHFIFNNTILSITATSADDASGIIRGGGTPIVSNNYVGDLHASSTNGTASAFSNSTTYSPESTHNVSSDGTADDGVLSDGIVFKSEYSEYFVSPSSTVDLHLTQNSDVLWGSYGAPLHASSTPVTQDIDGETRSTTKPCIGADENIFTIIKNKAVHLKSGIIKIISGILKIK
ncbi:DUF2341 domain-containing protein [Patescibacteria group bacterium]